MKTIINRYDLYRFERLVSKLVKQSDLPQSVSFTPCSEGLQMTAVCNGAALTFTVPSDEIEPFTLSWTTVKELASKNIARIRIVCATFYNCIIDQTYDLRTK